ncbi:MAG: T9SS type A sorting domain-containing protein [Ignavibacteriaceae bacterium]|nr:T9SS type A sorting domain-containing protein [Ignavibacteriaceae bacterium]
MIIEFNNAVPVELNSFTASVLQNERAVQLNWTTATETNNSGFEILRSCLAGRQVTQNDNDWSTIGFVPGFGTTTEPKLYSFTDESVTSGTYKFRLKQIDFDGSFTYSNEVEIEVDFTPKEFVLYQNYPNPFNPSTTIKFEIPSVTLRQAQSDIMVSLKVYDVLGNEVATLMNEEKQPGTYEVEFNSQVSHSGDVRNLTSGIYFYQLKTGSFTQTKKMILAK